MTKVRELRPGTAIAATCSGLTPLCANVYFQDTCGGIRDFAHASCSWSGGNSYSVYFFSKPQSPIAVVEWTHDNQRRFCLFTLDKENNIIESRNDGSKWYGGDLTTTKASPSSKLSAIICDENICLYYQSSDWDSDIAEIRRGPDEWSERVALPTFIRPKPLRGTSIASICWDKGHIRTYYQGEDYKILQASHEQVWSLSSLLLPAKPHSPLAAVTWFAGDKRHIRLYSLDNDDLIHEHCNDGGDWFSGPLCNSNIQAAPYSQLSVYYYDFRLRLYFQPANDDTLKEYCLDFGGDWFEGEPLRANPSGWKAVDIDGASYPVGWLPYIMDHNSWYTYDPALVDGVGILVGYVDGKIIGEDLKSKRSTTLAPNTEGNSYTWIYAPGSAILYRYCERDYNHHYDTHGEFGTGDPVVCAGQLRISENNSLQSVTVMAYDGSAATENKPTAKQCLGPVANKLQTLGLSLSQVDWYWIEK